MPRSKSSNKWLQEHFNDPYVLQSQKEGYRSRAVYKLKEIDEKAQLFKPNMTIVDLGAAPGGWSQYVAEKLQGKGHIIALDRLAIDPLPGVDFIQGDFREQLVLDTLIAHIKSSKVDVVLSDMAPNMSGQKAVDMPSAMFLAELAFEFCERMLKPGGTLVMKLFHGEGFDALIKAIRGHFEKVVIKKPKASRPRSRETYLLATGYQL